MPTSIYIHIPFCTNRCGYCDFNTYAEVTHLLPAYSKAIINEALWFSKHANIQNPIHSVYFGGGTPSLLTIEDLSIILFTLMKKFEISSNVEISIEANPGSVSEVYVKQLRDLGVTRISLGMQSADEQDLLVLDRKHKIGEVEHCVNWAASAGFSHVSLDLIFGIPGQTFASWQKSLQTAINLPIDHLSLYSLTIEDGTPLKQRILQGTLEIPDEDLAGEMYEYAIRALPCHGYSQYEISNWAKSDDGRSVHNMQYWRCLPYIGLGAGAHGYYSTNRYSNVKGIIPYINSIASFINQEKQPPALEDGGLLEAWDEMQEFMMLGLRLTKDGVSRSEFWKRFDFSFDELFNDQITHLIQHGLLENAKTDPDKLRLTPKGILFGNRVFSEFVGNEKPEQLS
jgi:oxygen-independent coproporphyrinogen-3 oxidase